MNKIKLDMFLNILKISDLKLAKPINAGLIYESIIYIARERIFIKFQIWIRKFTEILY